MYVVESKGGAIVCMLLALLFMGTWPALLTLLERRGRLPQHSYLDYTLANFLAAILIAFTFGQIGQNSHEAPNFLIQLSQLRYDETSYRYLYELPNCEWRKSENRIHQCLKVEFIGFYGYDSELDLVYYLFEKSVVLEKMIIDPKVRVIGKKWALVEQMENVSRTRAKLLQKYIPPEMEFLIL